MHPRYNGLDYLSKADSALNSLETENTSRKTSSYITQKVYIPVR